MSPGAAGFEKVFRTWAANLRDLAPATLVIVGGGRWGRTWATVAHAELPMSSRIVQVSDAAYADMMAWQQARIAADGRQAQVVRSVEEAVAIAPGAPAVIANAARNHEQAVRALLSARMPCLVEKPLSTAAASSTSLITDFGAASVVLAVGHVFNFASYVHRFGASVRSVPGRISGLELDWGDPASERRGAGVKHPDPGTPLVIDVWPHIDTLLHLVTGNPPVPTGVSIERAGRRVIVDAVCGGARGRITLARDAPRRTRRLRIDGDGGTGSLDFADEPGRAMVAGRCVDLAPAWNAQRSPLALELGCFLGRVGGLAETSPIDAETAGAPAHAADLVQAQVRERQRGAIGAAVRKGYADDDVLWALAENVFEVMVEHGVNQRDRGEIMRFAARVFERLCEHRPAASLDQYALNKAAMG